MKNFLLIMCGFFLFNTNVMGQTADFEVKGVVTAAETGMPLPGVNVIEKGTTNGVMTDFEGNYTIDVGKDAVLVFSYLGFATQEVPVDARPIIDVKLEEKASALDEVVVMGYSSKARNEITSAVATVSGDELKDITSPNVQSMLQGKVSGVQVYNGSGQPGSSPEVRIRGISSISAPQGPLYVVDGIIGGNFDPNDVETLTVLKDAGATGMYGSQANGGVIVVTTKKGTAGNPTLNFKAVTGLRVADHGNVNMMDSRTLYNYHRELYRDPNFYVIDDSKFLQARPLSLLETDTDWLDETFDPALVQNYHVSYTGKSEKTSFYIGGGFYDEGGTFLDTYYKRLNLRANTTYRLSDRITLTNNINLSASKTKEADYMSIYYAYVNMPWDNPYDQEGHPVSFKENENIWSKDKINPIQTAENSELTNRLLSVDYDFIFKADILDWLSFSSSNRLSATQNMFKEYYAQNADNLTYYGIGYVNSSSNISYGGISTNLFRFDWQSEDHSLSGLAGFEVQQTKYDYIAGSGEGLPEGLTAPSVASSNFQIEGAPSKTVMQSLISQVNYSFKDKYFLTGSFRIDESSAFSPENRTAYFPSLSGAWLVNKESFLDQNETIDNLKFKVSWGRTGMKDIGATKYLEQFAYTTQIDGQIAAVPFQLANPSLTWEQTDQFNVGLELGLFDRLGIDLNVYRNVTKDLLVYRDLPPSGGFRKQWQNTGSVVNKGAELYLTSSIINKEDFKWDANFSISYNDNYLKGFAGDTIVNANSYGITQIYRDGGSLYTWYAKEYHGINPETGGVQWVDKNGNITDDYQNARLVEYGSPIPEFEGGFATNIQYKNLTLSTNWSFVMGNKIYNYFRRYVDNDLQDSKFNIMMPREDWATWQKPGDIANHPLPQNARNSLDPSTRFIQDGDYLKMRNIKLTYQLTGEFLDPLKIKTMSVYLSADNLFTFTKFWGQDPEVSINPLNGLPGYAEFKYPNSKQYVIGLNINF